MSKKRNRQRPDAWNAQTSLTAREAADECLAQMGEWLGMEESNYRPAVMLFAVRLPPEKLIEALWAARAKKPRGGKPAFKYFCGTCHSMHRELSSDLQRN